MNKKFIITLVCFGFVSAAGAAVNFDQGVDVKSAVSEAAVSEVKVPEAKYSQLINLTRDCKKITFGQNDPLTSPEVSLTSVETTQDCQNMGYPVGQICFPSSRTYRENAKIVITEPRELQPDQKEVFEVCLWGQFLSLKPVSTVYKYSVNQVLGTFELTPASKAADVSKAPQQDTCNLVMDSNYSCIYQCKDGSYISKPNPFGPPPFPGMDFPFHGCRPSVPNTPLITILK